MATSGKEFPLSISLRAVDRTASGIKQVNDRLDKTFGPLRKLRDELGALGKNAGLGRIADGLKGIGGVARSVFRDIGLGAGLVAGAATGAMAAFKGLVEEFDGLGDKAEAIGVSVASLVQLRYAAEQSGAPVEALDSSLEKFNKSLGQAQAGTGRFAGFLKKVSPALLKQVRGAKSSGAAFDLLADAMAKLKDPSKKAALAASAGFDPSLIPLLSRGAAGVAALRKEVEESSKAQEAAAGAAGTADESLKRFGGQVQQVKASIVTALAPAFTDLTAKATAFLAGHQGEIAAWLRDFGEKLPGRIRDLITWFKEFKRDAIDPVVGAIKSIVRTVGGAEGAIKLMVAAWATFRGLQLAKGITQIVTGLVQMGTAAKSAADAVRGIKPPAAGAGAPGAPGAEPGTGKLGAALGGLGIGLTLGTLGDQWLGISDKISDTLSGHKGGDSRRPIAIRKRQIKEREAFLAVEEVNRSLFGSLNPAASPLLPGDVGAPSSSPARSEATVKVQFENAPKGTRVTRAPGGTAAVDLSVGYQTGLP